MLEILGFLCVVDTTHKGNAEEGLVEFGASRMRIPWFIFRRCFAKDSQQPISSLLSGLSKATTQSSKSSDAKTFDVSAIDKLFTPPSSSLSGKNRRVLGPSKPKVFIAL